MNDNNQPSQASTQPDKEIQTPFGNLKPAEIPTQIHTHSYQGGENLIKRNRRNN